MVKTTLEAHVAPDKWEVIRATFEAVTKQLPSQTVQTAIAFKRRGSHPRQSYG